MKIKKVLISQPKPQSEKSPYYDIAQKYGVNIEFRPFIKVEGLTSKEFRQQKISIPEFTAVIFTARTAIDHFFRLCEELRVTIPDTMKYFCTTEAIALYLQKYIVYRKRKIFFADGTFANFMELLNKHKEEKYLLTVSEPHKPEMPLAMEKLRLTFDKVVLARTVSADLSGINVNDYDMLVFYSPSEIVSLVGTFPGINGHPKIATFGHGTTNTAIGEGLTVSVMAPSPEAPSMTRAIELYLKKINAGETVAPVVLDGQSPDRAYILAQEAKPAKRRPAPKTAAATTKNSTTKNSASASKAKTGTPVKKSASSTPSK